MSLCRSLQVWEQTGRPHSLHLEEQRQQGQAGGGQLGGGLRYPHTAIFWVTCQQDVLNQRVDARVDEMIDRGLVDELLDFHASYNTKRLANDILSSPDYTHGIFQSIGFKEFHEYLVLGEEDRQGEQGKKLYQEGVEAMKLATRRYSKKQLRWIKNRFLKPPGRKVPPLYGVDGSEPEHWGERVREPALQVVEALLNDSIPALQPLNPPGTDLDNTEITNDKSRHECHVCDRVIIGAKIWKAHLAGNRHHKMLKRQSRLAAEGTGIGTDKTGQQQNKSNE
ncbi:hypothetical protein Pmani_032349 [Petrolisthes manimaculis]|uniref:tRNA isopentenyltransferase 1 n=1 Tax=Petrolisthes manimaculis TaxID=1843537 RepID=A0AAE1NTX8_9EUCA|nr:hypothetical protein Pmani_032349 [Petrolisthes manimaculis]